jgi:polysaccharide export outer membrane protein
MLLNRFIIALYFVLFSLVWSSCVSHKNVVYFQGDPQQRDMHIDSVAKAYVPTIKPGDILSIMVTSLSPDATIMFNPYQAIQAASPTLPPQYNTPAPAIGYLVKKA